jgi:LPS sulfotransferase NodH
MIPSRFCEVRYERLVSDPVGQIRLVYEQLGLGGFETVLPVLEAEASRRSGYRPNRYELESGRRSEVLRRWAPIIDRYGYPTGIDRGRDD